MRRKEWRLSRAERRRIEENCEQEEEEQNCQTSQYLTKPLRRHRWH
jgi:hypothetical protein